VNQKQKIFMFWNLIRGGYFAVLSGSVYALYRAVDCYRVPSFENAVARQSMPYLIETLVVSVVIMTAGGALGTYLLRRYRAE